MDLGLDQLVFVRRGTLWSREQVDDWIMADCGGNGTDARSGKEQ